jgi:hypothetical protein
MPPAVSATHRNHSADRSGRFVKIRKVCAGAAAITPNTAAICSLLSDSWNRSDMELAK